jgi:ribosomal protein L37E
MERSDDNSGSATLSAESSKQDNPPTTLTTSTAPDWNLVHFDVACARCGHDIRGRSEPTCPACQLEFDWANAVPLEKITCAKCDYHLYGLTEARCPECGESFDWNQALLNYRRKQKPLFEYRWREQPVRSLVRTWWMALRPGKFWRAIDIHDPPQVMPLVVFVAVSIALFWCVVVLTSATDHWLSTWLSTRSARRRGWPFTPPGMIENIRFVVSSPAPYFLTAGVVLWGTATLATLLLLQQSMRRHAVQNAHVVRVWAYTIPLHFVWCPIVFPLVAWSDALVTGSMGRVPEEAVGVIILLIAILAIRGLSCAYRNYLRIPHGLGIAVASQLIAAFFTGCVELAFHPYPLSGLFAQLARLVGLW